MDLAEYQRAIDMGFSEQEATKIGEEAWENRDIEEESYPQEREVPCVDKPE